MQVSIDNDELEKKVAIALKGINGRSLAQAILKCIIIKAKEDGSYQPGDWITGEGRRNGRGGRMLCD